MIETLKNAWKIPDLRKKMLFTLLILFLFRLGCNITVPFIDIGALQVYFEQLAAYGSALNFINVFTGGGLSQATIFAMSITPYINASIIMQLLTIAIPALERLSKEGGEEGKKKIAAITRYAAIAIGLIQGYSYYAMLRYAEYPLLNNTSLWAGIVIVLSFTAGTALIMWMGEKITQNGIGNGISLILFAGIVSRGPQMVVSMYNMLTGKVIGWPVLLLVLVMGLVMIAFVVFMSNAERRLPVQYAKRVVGRKMYGGQSTHLPIKVNASGVMPIIFASSILSLPATIGMFYQPAEGTFGSRLLAIFAQTHPVYIIVYVLMIFGFSYFYASVQFNPIEIGNNLKSNGGFIPGFRPGKPTSDFITKVLHKITFIGAIFLSVVAALPLLIGAFNQSLSGVALGGTSLLIVVGVALETVKQIEAQMMMRHYKGFLE